MKKLILVILLMLMSSSAMAIKYNGVRSYLQVQPVDELGSIIDSTSRSYQGLLHFTTTLNATTVSSNLSGYWTLQNLSTANIVYLRLSGGAADNTGANGEFMISYGDSYSTFDLGYYIPAGTTLSVISTGAGTILNGTVWK